MQPMQAKKNMMQVGKTTWAPRLLKLHANPCGPTCRPFHTHLLSSINLWLSSAGIPGTARASRDACSWPILDE